MKNWSDRRVTEEDWGKIPAHLREGITRWVEDGVPPGHFLQAVLRNDLKEAVGRADESSLYYLPNIVAFFYNKIPLTCWGSEERVLEWYRKKREGE